MMEFSPPLDKGIAQEVLVLLNNGIETFESCQGGKGHAYSEPTVRFHGDQAEGFKALSIAIQNSLNVTALKRVWIISDGEPKGPWWEMTFIPTKDC